MKYQRGTIFIGNSFKILKELPDECVDLIITDPPYDFCRSVIEDIHSEFKRICKGTIIVFYPPENQWSIESDEEHLFWIKPISTKNTSKHYSRFVEMISVYRREKSIWNYKRHWSQYTNVFNDLVDDASIHPYRKPISLLTRLIKNHSDENSKVFDPFCGSGSAAEVCKELNRQFFGIELLPNWMDRYSKFGYDVLMED